MGKKKAARRPKRRAVARRALGGIRETIVVCDERGPRLELTCGECGVTGRYSVGTVLVDPANRRMAEDPRSDPESVFRFTGYFRCRCCGAGGPWSFLPGSAAFLRAGFVALARFDPTLFRVGRLALFDGTVVRYATQAEDHLKELIERSPADPFLRDRLGNLYVSGGRPDLALSAFDEALALDPDYILSRYSRAEILVDEGRDSEAAADFHRVLRSVRGEATLARRALRDVVRSTLAGLLELSGRSQGRIPLLPPDASSSAGQSAADLDVGIEELDLRSEWWWRRLTDLFLPPSRFQRFFSRWRPRRAA